MARDHPLVRAVPRHRRCLNRRGQRALRAVVVPQGIPVVALALAQPPATKPLYRSIEPSSPHPVHFTLVARSNDLGRFYGRTDGVTPLSAISGAGTSHVTASAPPTGGAIIDLNISATAPPPSPATIDLSPNGLRIRSPPQNHIPNGSPPRLSPLGNRITHRMIRLPSSSILSRSTTTPQRAVTNARPSDSMVRLVRFN
jgi:hypothetical protein